MAQPILIEVQVPESLEGLRLPPGVHKRLQSLLDRLDQEGALSSEERSEAEGLADLAELLTFLRLRTRSLTQGASE